MKFTLESTDTWSQARAARLETAHGVVQTPIFMPVATQAVLRGVDTAVVDELDYQVLLANTYHLLLRPGPDLMRAFGGIHRFMQWPRAVLTDSGGFQIFSLSKSLVMTEEGAKFRSYVDGSEILLTPERSIAMQGAIGSDIMMVLDQCIDSTSDRAATIAALELTTRWAKRSLVARAPDSTQALFGIVQGACYKDLRRESALQITDLPFDGFAVGGLAVGESKHEREDMVEFTAPLLPADRPRYLMGVGTPIDLLEAVKRGVDMFDCILPTSLAHQGVCFTSQGKLDLRRTLYRAADEQLDPQCGCSTCRRFSRAYLHHLKRTDEHVGHQLLSVHNLTFYRSLMRGMRAAILHGTFRAFYETMKPTLERSDTLYPGKPARPRSAPTMALGDYEVVVSAHKTETDRQSQPLRYGSVRHKSSGEVMHSVSEPIREARALYVEQSGLVARAQAPADSHGSQPAKPLVVWDVGLGAATNAMVGILALEQAGGLARAVEIVSFEHDLDPLRLALRYPALFAHMRHGAPHDLLAHGSWTASDGRLSWRLVGGDFGQFVTQGEAGPLNGLGSVVAPDIIWFDPFSYKVNGSLWSRDFLRALRLLCRDHPTVLYTYSASTAIRAALLSAGWFVGVGVGTGPKSETTVAYNGLPRATKVCREACTDGAECPSAAGCPNCATARGINCTGNELLGSEWLAKWQKSDARQPFGTVESYELETVCGHAQFQPRRDF